MLVLNSQYIVDILNLEDHLVVVPIALQVDTKVEKIDQGETIFNFLFFCVMPYTVNTASFGSY